MLIERGVDGAVVRVDLDRIRLAVHRLSEDADDIHLIFRSDDGSDTGSAFQTATDHATGMSHERVARGADVEQVGSQPGQFDDTIWFDFPSSDELNQRWLRDVAIHLAEAGCSGLVDVWLEPDADPIVVPSGDAGLMSFWLGWRYDRIPGSAFELHWPWWREDDGSYVAAIRTRDEAAAKEFVLSVHERRPTDLHWLFAESRDDDWFPYTGRYYKEDWMPRWPETPAVYR